MSDGRNETKFDFKIPLKGCGTSKVNIDIESELIDVKGFENIIVIQNNPKYQAVNDSVRMIVCRYTEGPMDGSHSNRMDKRVLFKPFTVDMLDVITVSINWIDDWYIQLLPTRTPTIFGTTRLPFSSMITVITAWNMINRWLKQEQKRKRGEDPSCHHFVKHDHNRSNKQASWSKSCFWISMELIDRNHTHRTGSLLSTWPEHKDRSFDHIQ